MCNFIRRSVHGLGRTYPPFIHRTVCVFMAHGPVDKAWISPADDYMEHELSGFAVIISLGNSDRTNILYRPDDHLCSALMKN